jgi:hypothetical protein
MPGTNVGTTPIEDSLENYLNKVNVSICQLLFFLDIADIAKHVETYIQEVAINRYDF